MHLSKIQLNREHLLMALLVIGVCTIALFPEAARASSAEGKAFGDIWTTIEKWIQGGLGRLLCGSMMLVGAIAGVARQSLSTFAVGIGGGLGIYNLPAIVQLLIGATASAGILGAEVLGTLSNGLS